MSNGGIASRGGRKSQVGHLLRSVSAQPAGEGEAVYMNTGVRRRVVQEARYANDPDRNDYRARRTRGWKAHKFRYKWEHRLVEAEKHQTNRLRKAGRRKKQFSGRNQPVRLPSGE